MSKPLGEVTDEDLARNGLADFSINPRQIMPWRTEKERLTGVAPTAEEWAAIVKAGDNPTPEHTPAWPEGWQWNEGLSTNGEVYVMTHETTKEVAIWIWAKGMPAWAVLERHGLFELAKKRLNEIRDSVRRGDVTIAELAEAPRARLNHPSYGRF